MDKVANRVEQHTGSRDFNRRTLGMEGKKRESRIPIETASV
jgi:hypothetical protein